MKSNLQEEISPVELVAVTMLVYVPIKYFFSSAVWLSIFQGFPLLSSEVGKVHSSNVMDATAK